MKLEIEVDLIGDATDTEYSIESYHFGKACNASLSLECTGDVGFNIDTQWPLALAFVWAERSLVDMVDDLIEVYDVNGQGQCDESNRDVLERQARIFSECLSKLNAAIKPRIRVKAMTRVAA